MRITNDGITKVQATIVAVIIIIALIAGVYYATLPGPTPSLTPTPAPTPTPTPTATPTPTKTVLRMGFAWPCYIDPAVGSDECSSSALVNLYDPLIFPTPEGDLKVWLAESWTISADGLVYTLKIRSGTKFHSGQQLTAEDVKFSMDRIITIGEGYAYLFSPYIDKAEVIENNQVRFTLKKSFGPFLSTLIRLYIVEKAEVMAHIKTPGEYGEFGDYGKEWLLTHDAGSGPYKVREMKMEEWLYAERFKDYWAPMAPKAADEIRLLKLAASPATERVMMLNKELEITSHWLPPETYEELGKVQGIKIGAYPQGGMTYFMMNTQKPPLDDIYVRKALAYTFDYEADLSIYPYSRIADSPVQKGIPGYVKCSIYYYNLTKAEEELKQSKYYPDIVNNPDKYLMEVHYPAEAPARERECLLLAEGASKIGLKIQVVKTPWLKTIEEMSSLETSPHMEFVGVVIHYNEAGSLLESRYHSKSAKTWEQNEWLYMSYPEVDEKIEDALATVDRDARFAKYADLQRWIIEICPSIFTCEYYLENAYRDYVDFPVMQGKAALIMGYDYDARNIQILE